MTEETNLVRGEGDEAGDALQAYLDAQLESSFEQAATIELAGPQDFWNLYATGPYQWPSRKPYRVIQLGEYAWLYVIVWLNPNFPDSAPGQNACDMITGFGGKIELNFVTSNMQTMSPAPALNHTYCIQTTEGQCRYRYLWRFRPREAACLYETNICARICNCNNKPVKQYSGFVRWVEDLDVEWLFPQRPWGFDRPIRYMVSDMSDCECPD